MPDAPMGPALSALSPVCPSWARRRPIEPMAEDIDHPLEDAADDVSGRDVAGDGASSDVLGRPPIPASFVGA